MNPQSAKSLVGAGAISLLLGMFVGSPAGSLFLYVVAVLFAAVPTVFGQKGLRLAGAVVLLLSLLLVAATYPHYAVEMNKYRERGKGNSTRNFL